MKATFKLFLLSLLTGISFSCFSQTTDISALTPHPEKEKKFSPYIVWKHGGEQNFTAWKQENTLLYYRELWYYAESFYVKRNHLSQGVILDESIIDISRFESSRKENEESIVILPGFKDALVLLPARQLIYKP